MQKRWPTRKKKSERGSPTGAEDRAEIRMENFSEVTIR
jgi:hypothetical protein